MRLATASLPWASRFSGRSRLAAKSIQSRLAFSRRMVRAACGWPVRSPGWRWQGGRAGAGAGGRHGGEAVVRARTVENPSADYRSFVRSTTCQNGRFEFSGLPDGDWFIITPVSAGGDRIVLMRHIGTRGGRVSVTL